MKNITIALSAILISFAASASPIVVTVESADAQRLLKLIKKSAIQRMDGMIKTFSTETQAGGLTIECSSNFNGGIEHNYLCTVSLSDLTIDDSELKIIEAKKFSNLIQVTLISGQLQSNMSNALTMLDLDIPYQSVQEEVLLSRENNSPIGPNPSLKISCDKSEKTCDFQMSFKL